MTITATADRAGWLREAVRRLRAAGIDDGPDVSPRRSAELILCAVLGLERLALMMNPDTPIPHAALPELETLLRRRIAGEPAAYLLGRREFFGRDFEVSPATLIPRPESEHLVETALDACPATPLRFADLGTGSGCLAITLCLERPAWSGLAVDCSAAALRVAARNAARYGLVSAGADRVRPEPGQRERAQAALVRPDCARPDCASHDCVRPDCVRPSPSCCGGQASSPRALSLSERACPADLPRLALVQADFRCPLLAPASLDLLVSNPPYVSQAEFRALDPGVRDFEPATALVPLPDGPGEADGLEDLRRLLSLAAWALRPGGLLLMEHGGEQGPALRALLENNSWDKSCLCQDLSGKDRYIWARKSCGEKTTVVKKTQSSPSGALL